MREGNHRLGRVRRIGWRRGLGVAWPLLGRVARRADRVGLRSVVRSPVLRWTLVPVLALAGLAVCPLAPGRAVQGGTPARTGDAAQVKFEWNGEFDAGGTAVARDWVLASWHQFGEVSDAAYRVFGLPDDPPGGRRVLAIVPHELADLAMVQISPPLPAGTWTPELATRAPARLAPAHVFGWRPDGEQVSHLLTQVIDPVATANAAHYRQTDAGFAADFPEGSNPW